MNSEQDKLKAKTLIDCVLSGGLSDCDLDGLVSPKEVVKYLYTKGFEEWGYEDFDCNGWQYDWWLTLRREDQKFCLSGCWYYGGMKFKLSNDE